MPFSTHSLMPQRSKKTMIYRLETMLKIGAICARAGITALLRRWWRPVTYRPLTLEEMEEERQADHWW
jgi:hypothetical protein